MKKMVKFTLKKEKKKKKLFPPTNNLLLKNKNVIVKNKLPTSKMSKFF